MSNNASSPTPDASSTVKGKHKLTGDLGGTADSPTVVAITSGSASNLNSGTLPAGRLPALTGDVTSSAGSAATTLAAGSASNLNSGTLPAGRMPALTGDVTTSAGAVATTIGAATVSSAMLKGGAGNPGGAWTSFTPSWTNLTVGNATNSGAYTQIGKTVVARIKLVLGSTSSVGTAPQFDLPVTPSTTLLTTQVSPLGTATILDSGVNSWAGRALYQSTNRCLIRIQAADGTSSTDREITSLVPMTWGASDSIEAFLIYEAA